MLRVLFILVCAMPLTAMQTIDEQPEKQRTYQLESIIDSIGLTPNAKADTTLILFIRDWLGVQYCYGGKSRAGVDCSGFTNLLYESVFEKTLPRVSTDIYHASEKVKMKDLGQGDLVFFKTLGKKRVNHVGVYLWDGFFVHASIKYGVIISRLDEGYYHSTFVSGGRM